MASPIVVGACILQEEGLQNTERDATDLGFCTFIMQNSERRRKIGTKVVET